MPLHSSGGGRSGRAHPLRSRRSASIYLAPPLPAVFPPKSAYCVRPHDVATLMPCPGGETSVDERV